MKNKILTLCLVQDRERLLLAMKKRGFGAGHYNGFGGKVEEGETIEEAAKRETFEESRLLVNELDKRGILTFSFVSEPKVLEVHIFSVLSYSGELVETEEMRGEWFKYDEIPYDLMWPDDKYWLPLFLSGKRFEGQFLFDAPASPTHQAEIIEESLEIVTEFKA